MIRHFRKIYWSLGIPLAVALVLRLLAVFLITPHVDEPVSVIAAQQTASLGAPFLPSGILYLQGASLSYLYAPLMWLGLEQLELMRLPGVLIGSLSVVVVWLITRTVTQSYTVAALGALLIACDPFSVQWSAVVRPYALLQLISLTLVWRFLPILSAKDGVEDLRNCVYIVLLTALGVFTHVGILLILPALFLAGLLRFGLTIFGNNRRVIVLFAACLVAPALFLLLNKIYGVTSAASGDMGAALPMVGNHLISAEKLFNPSFSGWLHLFKHTELPFLLTSSVAILSLFALVAAYTARCYQEVRVLIVQLTLCFWLPLILVVTMIKDVKPRYLLHIHSFELVLLAVSIWVISTCSRGWRGGERTGSLTTRFATLIAVLLICAMSYGTFNRLNKPNISPDFRSVYGALMESYAPGDVVVTPWPPAAWLFATEVRGEIVFLAGSEGKNRTDRYTHLNTRGELVDFWLGSPSLTSINQLCTFMQANTGAWFVLKSKRFKNTRGLGLRMSKIVEQGTELKHEAG